MNSSLPVPLSAPAIEERWHPFYLLQPLSSLLMALLFEWFKPPRRGGRPDRAERYGIVGQTI